MYVKIVYKDDGTSKVIRGEILNIDTIFVTVRAKETNDILTLNKTNIVMIKELRDGK